MNEHIKLLSELTQLFGPSGFEDEVRDYLKNKYKELGYQYTTDHFGNVFAIKKSKKENAKKVMLIAHMDEVGFMVRKILPNGSLTVNPLGGFNSETILSSRAILKNSKGEKFYGSVNSMPPHLLKGASNEKTPISNMVFDFGFIDKDDALNHNVKVGDSIILEGNFALLNDNKRMLSKAFDDRYGLALGIEALKALKDVELDFDLIVGGVCQEEVGLRGSLCAAHFNKPDFAIVLDVSTALDSTGDTNEFGQLGKGVLIRVLDTNMIANKRVINYQESVLKENNIPYQYFIAAGGTDAGSVHKSLDGIPTLTYCLVARSIHTCSSILDCNDYLTSIDGLISLLKDLDEDKINYFGYQE